jgi:large subunit ribosomal protein L24
MKIRTGDIVKMLSGKDSGRTGMIVKVNFERQRVVVEGLNMVKKHIKKRKEKDEGGIISIPAAVSVAKVQLVCPKCNRPTRIRMEVAGKKKSRMCMKCKSVIEKTKKPVKAKTGKTVTDQKESDKSEKKKGKKVK